MRRKNWGSEGEVIGERGRGDLGGVLVLMGIVNFSKGSHLLLPLHTAISPRQIASSMWVCERICRLFLTLHRWLVPLGRCTCDGSHNFSPDAQPNLVAYEPS
jgi:hypothetical protein